MATTIHEHIVEAPSLEGLKISWGGIWAGVLVGMGLLLLLTTLGAAIGVSAVDPQNTDAGTFGTAAAIWTGLSLLISLFVGGMAATRLGMVFDKAAGAFEGALVWVISFLLILWLAGSGVSLVARSVTGLFSGVVQTVGATMTGIDTLSQGDAQQILDRLNNPQTARTIAAATGMSEQEVSTRLSDMRQRIEAVRNDPAQVAAEARRGAEDLTARARQSLPQAAAEVQEGATRAAWITFGAMAVSLLAAIAGAMLGRRRAADRLLRAATVAPR